MELNRKVDAHVRPTGGSVLVCFLACSSRTGCLNWMLFKGSKQMLLGSILYETKNLPGPIELREVLRSHFKPKSVHSYVGQNQPLSGHGPAPPVPLPRQEHPGLCLSHPPAVGPELPEVPAAAPGVRAVPEVRAASEAVPVAALGVPAAFEVPAAPEAVLVAALGVLAASEGLPAEV